jgi:hypothetical protein
MPEGPSAFYAGADALVNAFKPGREAGLEMQLRIAVRIARIGGALTPLPASAAGSPPLPKDGGFRFRDDRSWADLPRRFPSPRRADPFPAATSCETTTDRLFPVVGHFTIRTPMCAPEASRYNEAVRIGCDDSSFQWRADRPKPMRSKLGDWTCRSAALRARLS